MESLATYTTRQEIAAERDLTPGMFMDFVAYIDRSEATTRTYIINLRQFAAWLSFTGCARPSRSDVLNYRDYLGREHEAIDLAPGTAAGWTYRTDRAGNHITIACKPSTVAQYLRSVCQFFSWTDASGYYPNIAANIHAPKIRHDTHKKDALTPAEVMQIEDSIAAHTATREAAAAGAYKDKAGKMQRSTEQGKRLNAMYQLAVNAGLRTIEISRANIRDLETKGGNTWLYIWGKGHSEADQKKPISPEVRAAIDTYLAARTDKPTGASPLFVSTGNRSKGQRIAATTISTMLKRAMQEAGFNSERITAHSLRHTAGTNVQQLTGNLYQTQQYMRHSNPATTEIYIHTETDTQQAEIAQRLYNRYHGIDDAGNGDRLQAIIATMTPAQIERLTTVAEAMA